MARINRVATQLVGAGVGVFFCALSANATPCSVILSSLQVERGIVLMKQSEGRKTTEYSSGPNTVMSVNCYQGTPNIAVTWDGPTPEATFYNLVGTAGNLLTQRPASEVVKDSKQCRQEALKDEGEIATIELEGMAVECQAFKRDGGGTTITIFTE